jgi:dTDP-4-amino-4,6-dideoxy-D-glucose acyltransferase
MGYLGPDQVRALGLAAVGEHVLIEEGTRIVRPDRVRLGSHVRIDAFAVLSPGEGGIAIGDYVHVAAHCFLAGAASIEVGDFVNLSGRVSLYSSSDDFSGRSLPGPMVPERLREVETGPIRIGRHVIVGAGSVVLPGVTVDTGAAVGALSLVRSDVAAFEIVAGIPAHRIGERARDLLELEERARRS